MSGQAPTPGTLGRPPGSLGMPPQLIMNGAASPAKTIGQETRRQLLRVIVVLSPEGVHHPASNDRPVQCLGPFGRPRDYHVRDLRSQAITPFAPGDAAGGDSVVVGCVCASWCAT